jgi:hypothetical protein
MEEDSQESTLSVFAPTQEMLDFASLPEDESVFPVRNAGIILERLDKESKGRNLLYYLNSTDVEYDGKLYIARQILDEYNLGSNWEARVEQIEQVYWNNIVLACKLHRIQYINSSIC